MCPKFTFSDLTQQPYHQRYALTRIKVTLDHSRDLETDNYELDEVSYVRGMEKLRKMGWPDFALPFAYANAKYNVGTMNRDQITKANFYTQVPANFDVKNLPEYIQLLFEILLNKYPAELPLALQKKSRKFSRKQTTSVFSIELRKTNEACFLGDSNYPAVFHLGDASANLPFYLGLSLRKGIARMVDGFKCFTIKDGEIVNFDANSYSATYSSALQVITNNLASWHNKMQADQHAREEKAREAYLQLWYSSSIEEQEKINSSMFLVIPNFVEVLLDKTRLILREIVHDKTGLDYRNLFYKPKLKQLNYFLPLVQKNGGDPVKVKEISLDLAERFKKLGNHLIGSDLKQANENYLAALELYLRFPKEEFIQEKLTLYSNLIFVANRKKDFKTVLTLYSEASQFIPLLAKNKDRLIIDKIYGNTARAICDEVHKQSEAKQEDAGHIAELIDKAEKIISQINAVEVLTPVKSQFDALKAKVRNQADLRGSSPTPP